MNHMKKPQPQFHILIQDQEDKYGTSKGSIWTFESQITKTIIMLSKYEGEEKGALKQFEVSSLLRIDNETANLLLAIPPPVINRLEVVQDKTWIDEGINISVGARIEIYKVPGLPEGALGTIRFKGNLPGKIGISFGVELDPEHNGKGTTDGTFRHERLFTCGDDCGLFLSIFRIRALQSNSNKRMYLELGRREVDGASNEVYSGGDLSNVDGNTSFCLADDSGLKINERIVWMSDTGPEFGTVKWMGVLPYSTNRQGIVGVEFDNPVGSGTGKYKGNQLFRAKRNHASLIPPLGLLRASVYMSMMSDGIESFQNTSTCDYEDFVIDSGIKVKTDVKDNIKVEDSSLDRLIDQVNILTQRGNNAFVSNTAKSTECHKKNCEFSYSLGLNDVLTGAGITSKYNGEVKKEPPPKSKHNLDIGSRVKITYGKLRTGIIRWIGYLPSNNKPDQLIAGIEMDEADTKCYNAGMFCGKQIFECPLHKGFFFPLAKCEIDT